MVVIVAVVRVFLAALGYKEDLITMEKMFVKECYRL